MESLIKELVNIVSKHSQVLNVLSSTLINHSLVIKSMIGVCENCSTNIATVTHVKRLCRFCDSCAARDIVSSFQNENDWNDLEEAIEKRHLSTFVDALSVNVDKVKLH